VSVPAGVVVASIGGVAVEVFVAGEVEVGGTGGAVQADRIKTVKTRMPFALIVLPFTC
jgi:hypothetical protein